MSKTEFDVYCPGCNMIIAAKVVVEGNGGARSTATNPDDEIDAVYYLEHYYVCLCSRCNQPFLIRQSFAGVPGDFEKMTDEEILYPIQKKLSLNGVPNTIISAYDQAVKGDALKILSRGTPLKF